ncbi:hypothetical protein K435DRAFT_798109 [Dendrothele bispora CBS 962.96]|uniref:Uncharacterized protein n=1 Tax=Dendrothele bispora (strain CBS 962.96) TaxID=1314807 RepID=A0A4S8M0A5_DENBC|nr:hypothetical protein K435DRAFT_798109 [Dendrothele bispora CBS 962.96]
MSGSVTITVPSTGTTALPEAGAAPMGPIPVPGISLPAFDNTLGALYIGSTIATLLYGIICLQIFIYITSPRVQRDHKALKFFVICLELSVCELVTFLALPKATIYGAVGFLAPKTYLNTFLALLNAREYMRKKLNSDENSNAIISSSELPTSNQQNNKNLGGIHFSNPFNSSFSFTKNISNDHQCKYTSNWMTKLFLGFGKFH